MPRIALVDPELTVTVSALGDGGQRHGRDHPVDRELCFEEAATDTARSPHKGLTWPCRQSSGGRGRPISRKAREAMSQAALLSGITLTNAGLGMAHGVAAALGMHCRVPHGAACALMLPVAIRANLERLPRPVSRDSPVSGPPAPAGEADGRTDGRDLPGGNRNRLRPRRDAAAAFAGGRHPRPDPRDRQEFPRVEHERQPTRTLRRRTNGHPRRHPVVFPHRQRTTDKTPAL